MTVPRSETETLIPRAFAAFLHGNGFLPSLLRFLVYVPLSLLIVSYVVRLVVAMGGGKGWMGILILASGGIVAAALPIEDQDRALRRALTWIGRVVWWLLLVSALVAATEHTPLRHS